MSNINVCRKLDMDEDECRVVADKPFGATGVEDGRKL